MNKFTSISSFILTISFFAITACTGNEDTSANVNDKIEGNSDYKKGGEVTFNKEFKYGSFTDPRDNEVYKVVVLGSQTWMAENLRFKDYKGHRSINDEIGMIYWDSLSECTAAVFDCDKYKEFFENADSLKNFCDNALLLSSKHLHYREIDDMYTSDRNENCKYGRLYSEKLLDELCPDGWHLPNYEEWKLLDDFARIYSSDRPEIALRSKTIWENSSEEDISGNDLFGFNVYPINQYFFLTESSFWSSSVGDSNVTDCNSTQRVSWLIGLYGTGFFCEDFNQYRRRAVRCIRDSEKNTMGTVTDSRDGKKYKTVKIGNRTWMAENLNFDTDESHCPEDGCNTTGRLYTWDAAMSACPENYYLPSDADWEELFETVGGKYAAAGMLKAKNGWRGNHGSIDAYGFSVFPSSFRGDGKIKKGNDFAFFWSSSEYGEKQASHWFFLDFSHKVYHSVFNKDVAYSVRCIKGSYKASVADIKTVDQELVDPSTVILGTLVDERDGQEYSTATIGLQTWMAENLNLKTDGAMCFVCEKEKYGYHYSWYEAVDSIGAYSDDAKECGYEKKCNRSDIRGICPEGWHLPKLSEWRTLVDALGGDSLAYELFATWEREPHDDTTENFDYYGLDLINAGFKIPDSYDSIRDAHFYGNFFSESDTRFWVADEIDETKAYYTCVTGYCLASDNEGEFGFSESKQMGGSVRCIKD